jgi:hypothetical protein
MPLIYLSQSAGEISGTPNLPFSLYWLAGCLGKLDKNMAGKTIGVLSFPGSEQDRQDITAGEQSLKRAFVLLLFKNAVLGKICNFVCSQIIPDEACHPFHTKAATYSGEVCHP